MCPHDALGLQSERLMTFMTAVVEAADSHVYALWPQAMDVAIRNDI